MTQATELRELASLIHVDGSNSYVGISATAFTPTDAFIVKGDGARITVESADMEVAMLGRRGSSGTALDSGYLRLRNQGVTADGVVLDSGANSWINGGNLGIGTNSPTAILDVVGPAARPTSLAEVDTASTARFRSDSSNADSLYIAEASSGALIQVNDGATNSTTAKPLALQPFGGNVGIGETSPDYQLHVSGAGDIKIEDTSGGSAHLRIGASTSNLRNSEWKVKVSGSLDEFHIDHDYTANDGSSDVAVSGFSNAFKINSIQSLYNDNRQPTVRPTLNLDFANSKKLDDRLTFSRASRATYYNSKGEVTLAYDNEPRFQHNPKTGESLGLLIEDFTSNLVSGTEIFDNAYWSNSSGGTMFRIPHHGIAPDGTFTATKLVPDTTNDRKTIHRIPGIPSGVNTVSIYAKADGYTGINMSGIFGSNSSGYSYKFDLTGVDAPSANSAASITIYDFGMEDVGNGWYRCYVTYNNTNGTNYIVIGVRGTGITTYDPNYRGVTGTGNAEDGILVWGLQHESNYFASSYIPSYDRFENRSSEASYFDKDGILKFAQNDQERYSHKYSKGKWVKTRLFKERASTNILIGSNRFDDDTAGGGWWEDNQYDALAQKTVGTTSPEGLYNATKLVESTAAGAGHYLRETFSEVAGTTYAYSIFAKPAGRPEVALNFGASRAFARFNVNDGTVTQVGDNVTNFVDSRAYIENVGNGWYRCTLVAKSVNAGANYVRIAIGDGSATGHTPSYTGNGTDGIYIYGAQLEASSFSTSYIRTYGNSAARAADVYVTSNAMTREKDVCQMEDIDSWYDDEKGTIHFDADTLVDVGDDGSLTSIFAIADSDQVSTTNAKFQFHTSSSNGRLWIRSDANQQNADNNSGKNIKLSMSYDTSTITTKYMDGALTNKSFISINRGSATKPNYLVFGYPVAAGYDGNYTLRKFSYYPETLSANELIALSENN